MNGHTIGFHPQAQKSEPPYVSTTDSGSERFKTITLWLNGQFSVSGFLVSSDLDLKEKKVSKVVGVENRVSCVRVV